MSGLEKLSSEQRDLIERFLAAFNAIEAWLKIQLLVSDHPQFVKLVNDFSERNPQWKDAQRLKTYAKLRNSIVHGRTNPYEYLSIPIPAVVEGLESVKNRLTSPQRVIPAFERSVICLQSSESLAKVMGVINSNDFSQFPVYDGNDYVGFLTENGITRWLARYGMEKSDSLNFHDISVSSILRMEEKRANFEFFSKERSVDEAIYRFSQNPTLEAILITKGGQPNAEVLGIATQWDIIGFKS